ncbi:MAG: hypothetical protein ACYSTF_05275, partial [Planctomycetota bacterium]
SVGDALGGTVVFGTCVGHRHVIAHRHPVCVRPVFRSRLFVAPPCRSVVVTRPLYRRTVWIRPVYRRVVVLKKPGVSILW